MRISDWSSDVCSSDLSCGRSPDWSLPHNLAAAASCARRKPCPCHRSRHWLCSGHGTSAHTMMRCRSGRSPDRPWDNTIAQARSEEHTSELQSLMRISYAVFCLKTKTIVIMYSHSNTTKNYT